jgi:hypothetical protein
VIAKGLQQAVPAAADKPLTGGRVEVSDLTFDIGGKAGGRVFAEKRRQKVFLAPRSIPGKLHAKMDRQGKRNKGGGPGKEQGLDQIIRNTAAHSPQGKGRHDKQPGLRGKQPHMIRKPADGQSGMSQRQTPHPVPAAIGPEKG